MAKFEIPASPTYKYLDISNLRGLDSYDTNADASHAADMLNLIKRHGVITTRPSHYDLSLRTDSTIWGEDVSDLNFKTKYIGKFESYDGLDPTPYYIKISEKLGPIDEVDGSSLWISVWPTPVVDDVYNGSEAQWNNGYIGTARKYKFTNKGETGDKSGLYNSVDYEGTTWVFTPIGILTFKCSQYPDPQENSLRSQINDIDGRMIPIHLDVDETIFSEVNPESAIYVYSFRNGKWVKNGENVELEQEGINLELNLCNSSVQLGTLDTETGLPIQTTSAIITSDYVELPRYSLYSITNSKAFNQRIFTFNENKQFIRAIDGSNLITINPYDIEKYIKVGTIPSEQHSDINVEYTVQANGTIYVPAQGDSIQVDWTNGATVKKLDFEMVNVLDDPYIPTIAISRNPNGEVSTMYESINMLTDKRNVQFLSDGVSTQYVLPEKYLTDGSVEIKILTNEGLYSKYDGNYTVNYNTGVITFSSAPPKSVVDGKDNIIVTYEKPIVSGPEDNEFDVTSGSSSDLVLSQFSINKTINTSGKLELEYNVLITRKTSEMITSCVTSLNMNDKNVFTESLTDSQLAQLNSGSVSLTGTIETEYEETSNRNWYLSTDVSYNKTTTTGTTSPGSVASPTVIPSSVFQNITFYGQSGKTYGYQSWMGMKCGVTVTAVCGIKTDGSDSYWKVSMTPQYWVNDSSGFGKNSVKLLVYFNGSLAGSVDTGFLSGYGSWPSNKPVTFEIPYKASLNNTDVKYYIETDFYPFYWRSKQDNLTTIRTGASTVHLPKITLPTDTTKTEVEKISKTYKGEYRETIDYSRVSKDGKMSCYYYTQYSTVYGYGDDRRIFVTDGSSSDTYSGVTKDGRPSIYYFPDDNYMVLGENTEIMGYAQIDGYLLTFKRGSDSVYVRYSTTINGEVVFPTAAVTKNLQVLASPIQVENEVLVLTKEGVKGLIYTANEVRAYLRSHYINNYFELSQDYDYDHMQWFKEENLLHILLNEYDFVADLTDKTTVKEASIPSRARGTASLQFQYEWYVNKIPFAGDKPIPMRYMLCTPRDFENVPNSFYINNVDGLFALGYNEDRTGYLFYGLGSAEDAIAKSWETEEYNIGESHFVSYRIKYGHYPIPCYHVTPFLNFDIINLAKTIKYVYINTHPIINSEMYMGYINEEGEEETMEKIYENILIEDKLTPLRNGVVPFPKLIQVKSKIKKFMNIKLYIYNRAYKDKVGEFPEYQGDYYGMNFDRILIQYQVSGKYRGE